MVTEAIEVKYKAFNVGALSFDTSTGLGAFEYSKDFIKTGLELAPLKMPLSDRIYTFSELNRETFKGLPGMVADSLPDDFGNSVLNAWVAAQGRLPSEITPLERLKYTGTRGMGALEYLPAKKMRTFNAFQPVEIAELVKITQDVLDTYSAFEVNLTNNEHEDRDAMLALLSVGTSAGGARPKAVLAFNDDFTQVRSGQTKVPEGFTHYLMKFDGVSEHHKNKETFGDPLGFGAMEYVYHLMAKECGIDMMPCRLLNEGHRRHFMTQRFDRIGNQKIHIQSLNGIAHVDYKKPGSYSYAELLMTARRLKLSAYDADQILKRMVFNIVARNHDDHSKNFAFVFENKAWRLSPAYDLAYSYKPESAWVSSHWMVLNGKRDHFSLDDFLSLIPLSPLFTVERIKNTIGKTIETVSKWRSLATHEGVPHGLIDTIESHLRLHLK
jgi:serine/threonine-protein kinase HipA